MKLMVENKIFLESAIKEVGNWEQLNGYYRCKEDYLLADGKKITYYCSNFSNISDIIEIDGERIDASQGEVRATIDYDVYWEDMSYDIESLKEELKDEEDKETREEIEEDLKEKIEEQEEYENLYNSIDFSKALVIDNIGLGASSSQDFDYWSVTIDIENGVVLHETYESTAITDDLYWVSNFLQTAYMWFVDEKIIDYIFEHQDFFDDFEIIGQ